LLSGTAYDNTTPPQEIAMPDGSGGFGRQPGRPERHDSVNVLGGQLEACALVPLTGFFRNGCCDTGPQDRGSHTVCALMDADFLRFSAAAGNDLSTPRPEYGFPGLRPGDRWCLCAPRWQEALQAGHAPRVVLAASHIGALAYCALEDLIAAAVDSGH
jgi:uncharacterized protein (DUF2237 family)